MSSLRTNYKDDVFTGSRKYEMTQNGDGTVSFTDQTTYSQVGDTYGAAQINEANAIINNLDDKAYLSDDGAESGLADNDYFPFYDTSASNGKKTTWSNIKNLIKAICAIKDHASSTASTYGAGTASQFGHVKLSDAYLSSGGAAANSVGASSAALNSAYSKINNQLKANNNEIYMDYKNGKYGYNTSSNRGADTFHPFSGHEYLGTGTSFDVSSIHGYQNFTADNFVCEPVSVAIIPSNYGYHGGGGHNVGQWGITGGSGGITKSYNASTGVLTAYLSAACSCGVNYESTSSGSGQVAVKCYLITS